MLLEKQTITADQNKTRPARIDFGLPVVLSIGPQRCATSWLDRYLRRRGDVCLPADVKEIRYFDKNYDRGAAFYKRHFRPAANHSYVVEITTTCFDEPDAPRRVFEAFGPNVKLLCPLRHPVARSYSLYMHYKRYGLVDGPLQQACEQQPQILTSSHYAAHIENWLTCFPIETIKFSFQEALEADQDAYIADLCRWLEIAYMSADKEAQTRFNSTAFSKNRALAAGLQKSAEFLRRHELYKPINMAKSFGLKEFVFGKEQPKGLQQSIKDEEYKWLREQLSGEIQKLEHLIGAELPWT